VPALKGVSEAELYAVCTAHTDTAQAAVDKFGVTRAYSNDRALGADAEVEAVLVAARMPAHPNILIFCQRQEYARADYDVETFCSSSTLFLTVGRFIMRSCHAV
jgi:hypothetical protein